MEKHFALVAFAAILLFAGCISEQNIPPANNSSSLAVQPLANASKPNDSLVFSSLDAFRLNNSIPAGYKLLIEAQSTPKDIAISPNADYLGVGMPLMERIDFFSNSNRSGFIEKMTLYPSENASKIMQKDIDYINGLETGGNWSASGIEHLQSPQGAVVYLEKSTPPKQSASYQVDYAIGNAMISIIVSTDPGNPHQSDKELAISVAQLVAKKVQN